MNIRPKGSILQTYFIAGLIIVTPLAYWMHQCTVFLSEDFSLPGIVEIAGVTAVAYILGALLAEFGDWYEKMLDKNLQKSEDVDVSEGWKYFLHQENREVAIKHGNKNAKIVHLNISLLFVSIALVIGGLITMIMPWVAYSDGCTISFGSALAITIPSLVSAIWWAWRAYQNHYELAVFRQERMEERGRGEYIRVVE